MSKRFGFLALILMAAIFVMPMNTAYANSAPPMRPDSGSGIVFKQHDRVQIQREVLNIALGDDSTASINAVYTMENTSSEAITVETMFLTPVENGENKDISVTKNGQSIAFTQEFFGFYDYDDEVARSIDDWESILAASKSPSTPFGDGTGFSSYHILASQNNNLTASFTPDFFYFYYAQSHSELASGQIDLVNHSWYNAPPEEMLVIARAGTSIQTNGTVVEIEIDNIYDFLYKKALDEIYFEGKEHFSVEQFNTYLANIDTTRFVQTFFNLRYVDKYIGAITYLIDFAPNEVLELSVSYKYQMALSGYSNTASLLYYLTPAKYWKGFGDIEINLTTGTRYKSISSSSLKLVRLYGNKYQYTASSLPETELRLTFSSSALPNWGGYGVGLIFLSFAVMGAIIAAPFIVMASGKKKRG